MNFSENSKLLFIIKIASLLSLFASATIIYTLLVDARSKDHEFFENAISTIATLKHELAEKEGAISEIMDVKNYYASELSNRKQYYCTDGFRDGDGVDISVSSDDRGNISMRLKILNNDVLDGSGRFEITCLDTTKEGMSNKKPNRTFMLPNK